MPTLAAPSLRLVSQSETAITLGWSDPNPSDTGTEVSRAVGASTFVTVASVSKQSQAWTDTALPVATTTPLTVTYRVRAHGKHNEVSAWSNLVSTIIAPAQAGNAATAPSLLATFDCISWRAACPGNVSGTTTIQPYYKPTSSGPWRALGIGYATDAVATAGVPTCLIDLRQSIDTLANPYKNEARGSIVGLAANTSYDVYVVWSTGAMSPATTITTLSTTVPYGGTTRVCNNDTDVTNALAALVPGDTIQLNAGTYNAFTVATSGTSSAWIKVTGAGTITGTGASYTGNGSYNLRITGNYIDVFGLTFGNSDNGCVSVTGHHVFVRNCEINFGAACNTGNCVAGDECPLHYGDTGIATGTAGNVYVLNNLITWLGTQGNLSFHGPGTGVGVYDGAVSVVIKGNSITGMLRDGIASDDSVNVTQNCDIANNTVTGFADDGVESKGGNLNVRVWGNVVTQDQGNSAYALNTNAVGGHAGNLYGPLYVFRNAAMTTGSLGTQTWKLSNTVPLFLFHNATDSSGAGSAYDCLAGGGALIGGVLLSRMILRNNAYKVRGQYTFGGLDMNSYDYDCAIRTNASTYAGTWNIFGDGTTTYDTWVDFTTNALDLFIGAGAKQEAHGVNSDPLFVSTSDLHLQAGSPAINAGVVIPNFNDANSAWPFLGAAPDCGAFEKS